MYGALTVIDRRLALWESASPLTERGRVNEGNGLKEKKGQRGKRGKGEKGAKGKKGQRGKRGKDKKQSCRAINGQCTDTPPFFSPG